MKPEALLHAADFERAVVKVDFTEPGTPQATM